MSKRYYITPTINSRCILTGYIDFLSIKKRKISMLNNINLKHLLFSNIPQAKVC